MLTFFSSNLFCCLLQILRSLRGVIFWWYVGAVIDYTLYSGGLERVQAFQHCFSRYILLFVFVNIFNNICCCYFFCSLFNKMTFCICFYYFFLVNFIIVVVFSVFFCSLVLAYFRFGFPYCGGGVSSLLLCHYKQYWPRFCCCKFFVVIVMNILRISV